MNSSSGTQKIEQAPKKKNNAAYRFQEKAIEYHNKYLNKDEDLVIGK